MIKVPVWDRSALCAVLALAQPELFGGIVIRAGASPVRQKWLEAFHRLAPGDKPPVIVPASVAPDRLYASWSLARSIASGRPVQQPGLIDEAAGSTLVINMAERIDRQVAALVSAAMDENHERGHVAFCALLLDESDELEAGIPDILAERVAFHVDLNAVSLRDAVPFEYSRGNIELIKSNIDKTVAGDKWIKVIVETCLSVGINSMRVPLFCLATSRALAALNDETELLQEHVSLACQLVLAGRNLVQSGEPQQSPEQQAQSSEEPASEAQNADAEASHDQGRADQADEEETSAGGQDSLQNEIVEAVTNAAVEMRPPESKRLERKEGGVSGRSGELGYAFDRGRPDRVVRYQPGKGRVDVLATLRAAAPMQAMRGRTGPGDSLKLRKDDLRTKRFKRRKQCSVIFVVDASGSSAMHRMGEAKGAMESLLSQCYARRDLVSLVAFAGYKSEIVLPPTRSLLRAQRKISALTGGGPTPLAHALATASTLALSERSRGRTPFLVFMSDGRGNISLEGEPDRARSAEQASGLAKRFVRGQVSSVYFDTSRRPDPRSKALSDDLGAQYEFLPMASAGKVSAIVRERIGSQ